MMKRSMIRPTPPPNRRMTFRYSSASYAYAYAALALLLSISVLQFPNPNHSTTPFLFCTASNPPNPKPYRMIQPDGITNTGDLYLRGTLEYNWEEDSMGYTVLRDEDGYEVYAVRGDVVRDGDDDSSYGDGDGRGPMLVSSHCVVGSNCDPAKAGGVVGVRHDELLLRRPAEKALAMLSKAGKEFREASRDRLTDNAFVRPLHSDLRRARDIQKGNSNTAGSSLDLPEGEERTPNHHGLLRGNDRELQGGTVMKNMVLMLRFSDHVNRTLPTRDDLDVLFNTINGNPTDHPNICPTGSVRDCFLINSYGNLDMQSELFGWIDLPNTERYYADAYYGVTGKMQDGIKWAMNQVQTDLNAQGRGFRDFDVAGDGWIDGLTVIHSGYDSSWGGPDCYDKEAVGEHRIWSHYWNMGTWTSNDWTKVDDYHMNSALWGNCDSEIARIGVICHETAHFLGLPDLYDGGGGAGLGSWALMANSWGFDGSQYYPPMMSPWSKIRLGLIQPTYITEDGVYDISASHSNPFLYVIKAGFPDKEYLIIENKQIYHKFDAKIPQSGLMIWHIDETANISIEGHPDQAGWPGNGKHYAIAILAPDGEYDLEKGSGSGDEGDVFHAGGVNEIGPDGIVGVDGVAKPHPNTDAYQNGNIARTGHRIYDIGKPGENMTFKYCLDCKRNNSTNADTPIATTPTQPTLLATAAPTIHSTASPLLDLVRITDAPTYAPSASPSEADLPDATLSPVALPSGENSSEATLSPSPPPSNATLPDATNATAPQNTFSGAGQGGVPSELGAIPSSASSDEVILSKLSVLMSLDLALLLMGCIIIF